MNDKNEDMIVSFVIILCFGALLAVSLMVSLNMLTTPVPEMPTCDLVPHWHQEVAPEDARETVERFHAHGYNHTSAKQFSGGVTIEGWC